MISPKILIFTIVLPLVLLIGAVFAFSSKDQKFSSQRKTYQVSDSLKPKIKTDKIFVDLGKMKVSAEKSTEFLLTNIGKKPLQLFEGSSSCSCTFGQINTGKDWTPEFGMHSAGSAISEVLPGKNAKIKVIYRPSLMPVYGEISRSVYLSTNDPQNQKITFTVKAFVE